MQDRYVGDIGDYVKFALLRALGEGERPGVVWYRHPDEDHNSDGGHTAYLDRAAHWRWLDPELFDLLATVRRGGARSLARLEQAGIVPRARFASDVITTRDLPAAERSAWRAAWFARVQAQVEGCSLVFADPDNGLVCDDPQRRRQRAFAKQMPLADALALAEGRTAVLYHHNTRTPGGHDREVEHWQALLGPGTIAVRATAWACRTFFVVNPTPAIRARAEGFADRWRAHKVRLHG